MFVTNYPAMVINKCLIIADIHIGITRELYKSGITIPRPATRLAKDLNKLKNICKAKKLVILGDLKHKVPGMGLHEMKEIPEFFRQLDFEEIVLVKGNHDGMIEKILPDYVSIKKSCPCGDYLLTHGHRRVHTKKKKIVIGHNHPKIKFKDKMGAVYFEPVWIKGEIKTKQGKKELIIMPAFNKLCGAMIVNDESYSDKQYKLFMGPIAKCLKNVHVYLLDSTDLGSIKDLKVK